ncbi:hypothetical protein CTAYLR_009829 [Chrysophaeum taylorii]|uniref:Elongation of fatty acids protein n=1 Tax=Chrysophaeum taylorii TaxID=2483200 RepID=A0AAD7UB47_9STRA|nr:hypothetical protein CTAYLR_009829 [Chrysophaeum taylorii]
MSNSTLALLRAWAPDLPTIKADLTFTPPEPDTSKYFEWNSYQLHFYNYNELAKFNGHVWSRFTAVHWEYPLVAVAAYVVMIPLLRALVKDKVNTKSFAIAWNAFLAIFSLCGLLACGPVMLHELTTNGLYFTVCAPAPWYGVGVHGMFVALFIFSKFAELVDTVLLLLSKRPVILLHWWHHVTVLLYCWHSYAVQIATGLWFATMNYCVHTIMYAYFAATQTSLRKAVRPFAIYITLLQLLQMLVGIFVTVRAVIYQATGTECHVNKTNSILGLTMYASYFFLFFKLFLDNYVTKKKPSTVAQQHATMTKKMKKKTN